jgi:hypothetical protein
MTGNSAYVQVPHPGNGRGGKQRSLKLPLNCWPTVEEWQEFRLYLARDRMAVGAFFNRAIREYIAECRKFYQEINEEEKTPPLADR